MTLKLYYAAGACSLASHICLEEAGAKFELARVDLAHGQQNDPDYLRLNPKGRVPLLATEQGTLTESGAILGWIAAAFPEARLSPQDPWGRAQVESFNSYIGTSLHAGAFASLFRPARFSNDPSHHAAIKARGLASVQEHFAVIEAGLAPDVWVHGDYSTSDPYLLVMARWFVRAGQGLSGYPKLRALTERCLARPAVQRAFAAEGITFG